MYIYIFNLFLFKISIIILFDSFNIVYFNAQFDLLNNL